jgi:hypothetical protein
MTNKLMPELPTEEMLNPIAEAVKYRRGLEFGDCHKGSLGYYKRIFLAGYKAMYASAPIVECEPSQSLSVGYVTDSGLSAVFDLGVNLDDGTPLYTIPQDQSKRIAELEERLRKYETV